MFVALVWLPPIRTRLHLHAHPGFFQGTLTVALGFLNLLRRALAKAGSLICV
ncbi:MAG: hypothetical protein M3Y17_14350 [Actinomycetota bacterium]|nr:hypothetical protein [Actinomycetota bacterium]